MSDSISESKPGGKLSTILVVIVVGLGAGTFFLYQNLQKNKQANAELQTEISSLKSVQEKYDELLKSQVSPDELTRLRQAQTELLRLRGQNNVLKKQLDAAKAKQVTKVDGQIPEGATDASQWPVKLFLSTATADLKKGQTMVIGGWETSPGKRTIVLLTPEIDPNENNQVSVEPHFIEAEHEVLIKLGFDYTKVDSLITSGSIVIDPSLVKTLEDAAGEGISRAPQITTGNGRQAQVSILDKHNLDGQVYHTGQAIDVTPTIGQNGSISLVVEGTIIQKNQQPAAK